MKKFIFDVDGTLTPSRKMISFDFLPFFYDFILENEVYLVTGSDKQKTYEQVTPGIYDSCVRVYNCSGSDVYEGDKNVYRDTWELPKKLENFLRDELDYSKFPIRTGKHIEKRPGNVNFSILGRGGGVNFEEREMYVEWDKDTNERADILDRLKNEFPDLSIAAGGQTGLDIGPLGSDKSQILRDFSEDDELYFFGDKMDKGGNDYTLAEAVKKRGGHVYHVKDYHDTMNILRKFSS